MDWSILDIVLSVVLLIFGVHGLTEGFARQLATLITFFLTVAGLYFAYPLLLEYLACNFPHLSVATVTALGLAALALICIGLFVILKQLLVSAMLSNISEKVDKGLGFVFGVLRGGLIMLLILSLVAHVGSAGVEEMMSRKSIAGKWICEEFIERASSVIDRDKIAAQMEGLRDRVELPTPAELIE